MTNSERARKTAEKVLSLVTEKLGLEPVISPIILEDLDEAVKDTLDWLHDHDYVSATDEDGNDFNKEQSREFFLNCLKD